MRDVTIGVVGLGSIGRAVARLALAFGARVVAIRREGAEVGAADPVLAGIHRLHTPAELPELLSDSDFVVLALPLTAATDGLIDAHHLGRMKPGGWLINVARGGLVDERALVRALRSGALGGAVLDTVRQEPVEPASPLYDVPNLILTPHTSWSSGRVLDRSIELFCDNLERFARGEELLNAVDPGKGY
jgi:phosphoglycerate dehydrogenase-like enzyme